MVADISGMPVEVVHVTESAAVGSGAFPSFKDAMETM